VLSRVIESTAGPLDPTPFPATRAVSPS
jgi:hypothetical protein